MFLVLNFLGRVHRRTRFYLCGSSQKFSIIQTLFWPVAASKAPYLPSGDGTTHQYRVALSPSSSTRLLPLGSTPNITGSPSAVWLATNTLLLSAAQSMPPRGPHGLRSTSRVL